MKMVNIKGIIGERPSNAKKGELYVNLLSVIQQVQTEGEGEIHVFIDSIGGDLDMGVSIYNYLLNLPNKTITECSGSCASAASVVFLAGDERIAGCPIMIHNPYIEGVSGDRRMMEAATEYIGKKENECKAIYADRTLLDTQTLASLMDNETYISPTQAVALGFATQSKVIAFAKLNTLNINQKEKTMNEKRKSIREIFGLKPKVKAMDLTTADGSTLTVKREEGEPQIGDEASPDGSFTMPDGSVIVVTDGKISEINTVSAEGVDITPEEAEEVVTIIEEVIQENEELKKENEDLKEQVASAKAMTKSDEDVAILNAIMKAGGKEWLAKQCSHYKPKARIGVKSKDETQAKDSRISAKLADVKQKRGIN